MKSEINLAFYLIIFCSILFGCADRQNDVNKIEIYCWCFSNEKGSPNGDGTLTSDSVQICLTTVRVKAYELINQEHLLDTIVNAKQIEEMTNVLFSQPIVKKKDDVYIDARLVMVLRRPNEIADTLVYYDYKTLVYNGARQINYPYHIIDSIQAIRNNGVIFCPSN